MSPHNGELTIRQTLSMNRINYKDLNPRQREIFNFQKISGVLADYGFNCIKLADDWQGADFLAYHKDGLDTLKVQLKSRLTINKKYIGKELFMAFPIHEHWYLVEHDPLIEKIREWTTYLKTKAWAINGLYHTEDPNPQLIQSLSECRL